MGYKDKLAEEQIRDQINVYEREIKAIYSGIEIYSRELNSIDSERSYIGGPYRAQMVADISAREQRTRAQQQQLANRLPQLDFELKRLRAMLDEE